MVTKAAAAARPAARSINEGAELEPSFAGPLVLVGARPVGATVVGTTVVEHPGRVMTFVSSVTAPLRARTRPATR